MSEGIAVLSSSKVALKGHKFAAGLNGHAMVTMVVVHVAVGAVSGPTNAAGDGGGIKPNFIRQGLQTRMNFFSGVKANKQVIATSRPFHGDGLGGEPMRMPFIPLEEGRLGRGVHVPWP